MRTVSTLACKRVASGKSLRMSRICDPVTGRTLIVPMDHSVTVGPLGHADHADTTVCTLAEAGANAVVLHRGRARHVDPVHFARMALIVHLSAGTNLSLDIDAKVLVSGVDDALRLGADAVSIHVNIGSVTERRQLADFAAVSRECDTLGMPLLAMMYARGPQRSGRPTSQEIAHLAAIATDLGADMVKLDYTGATETMRTVVDSCPIPICVAGGDRAATDDAVLDLAGEILDAGVAGLSFGRNVFGASNPLVVATALSAMVHGMRPTRTNEHLGLDARLETA
ncbi:2-amino-3,7-dideoxy-D-threo-hept-6-ulosonate synthase [Rhodococcus rhodochrous J3]|uniref:2-amino-3,7-dideoxy-D-threo-hept-6-ulosonate synthase n=1 Tax=Rhodococcus rhodochrous J3 TaxID=903528 RepID=A0ABY1M9P5_RHORH|nr:2-amino-3,7-dideoxy-D-threo-hept-6-ulosonate synthase [Rhodococcus rhodochrous]MBF4481479.1 transaldolase [Rhodococcus rhodochrous]SMG32009.1 2-amino-3,7-dideoxy-D-threo-hept-6-ulosonate synthase [Rhodococcus rhodochrous J3]